MKCGVLWSVWDGHVTYSVTWESRHQVLEVGCREIGCRVSHVRYRTVCMSYVTGRKGKQFSTEEEKLYTFLFACSFYYKLFAPKCSVSEDVAPNVFHTRFTFCPCLCLVVLPNPWFHLIGSYGAKFPASSRAIRASLNAGQGHGLTHLPGVCFPSAKLDVPLGPQLPGEVRSVAAYIETIVKV